MKHEIYTDKGLDIEIPIIQPLNQWELRDTTLPFYLLVLGISIVGLLVMICTT